MQYNGQINNQDIVSLFRDLAANVPVNVVTMYVNMFLNDLYSDLYDIAPALLPMDKVTFTFTAGQNTATTTSAIMNEVIYVRSAEYTQGAQTYTINPISDQEAQRKYGTLSDAYSKDGFPSDYQLFLDASAGNVPTLRLLNGSQTGGTVNLYVVKSGKQFTPSDTTQTSNMIPVNLQEMLALGGATLYAEKIPMQKAPNLRGQLNKRIDQAKKWAYKFEENNPTRLDNRVDIRQYE